ncbi:MAG TPA: hypothetical protein DCQ06_03740 [Myxococcales bacterium]|nr:hypothetical protein [Myxococcales bacterium]HAN30688.1 hypothetical protein [Myxococcales bacterium]
MPKLRNTMDRSLLRGFERVSVRCLEFIHGREYLRTFMHRSLASLTTSWTRYTTQMLWQLKGFERIEKLKAPRGLIMVSNHRSFFDMYMLGSAVDCHTRLMRRASFPVRATFFYTRPLGLLFNLLISGGDMWPPIFRDPSQRPLNRTAFAQVSETLTEGSFVGIHPEGRRNPGDDPYEFLPLKPGLGHLLAVCDDQTWVIPAFVAGLSNRPLYEVTRGWWPGAERGSSIRLWFGEPIRVGDLNAGPDNAAQTTDAVFAHVRALAQQDKQYMEQTPDQAVKTERESHS